MSHKLLGGSDQQGRNPVASSCRIAARLRSQAVPIVWASGCLGTRASASTCRIAASLRSQAGPIVWASGCLGTWDGNGHDGGHGQHPAGSRPQAVPIVWASGMPDRGQRLTLTGGAYRVGVRMPDRGSASLRLATA